MNDSPSASRHRRYRDRLDPVLDHVRQNLREDLSVEALARVVHFSPYHFHRVFRSVMGETIGTFVRRARLERAVYLMKSAPDRSLTAVAAEAGFSSLSDFSRSFRRYYGTAPSKWDRRTRLEFADAAVDAPPSHDLEGMIAEGEGEGEAIEVELKETPASRLAYVRIRRPFETGALERGYSRLRSWLEERALERGALLGLSWDDIEITPPDQIRYDFACTVPAGVRGGDGVGIRDLPALVIAAAHAEGDLSRVARVWDHLYHHWLPDARFEPYNLPAFEWYRHWPERLDEDRWNLDCCIPLKVLEAP